MKITVNTVQQQRLLTWDEIPNGIAYRSTGNTNHTYVKVDGGRCLIIGPDGNKGKFSLDECKYWSRSARNQPYFYPVEIEISVLGVIQK